MSSCWIVNEIEHLRQNYAPQDELNRAFGSLDRANLSVGKHTRELEAKKKRSQGEITDLLMKLDEAQHSTAEFMAKEYKKIVEYINLQNATIECDVSWSLFKLSNEHPGKYYSFLHECFKAECNVANDMDDDDNKYE